MTLAETPLGLAWIRQFNPEHQETARLLLDTLRCVSHNAFHRELRDSIARAIAPLGKPIAFYPAREVSKGESFFVDARQKPVAVRKGHEVGSEGTLANVITTLNRQDPVNYLNCPPIMTLRKRRCRNIVVLDDLSGSGDRLVKFLKSFRMHGRIKSWYSFGWLSFHVVAYAISDEAQNSVTSSMRLHGKSYTAPRVAFAYSRRPYTYSGLLSDDMRLSLEELCRSYGEDHKVPWMFRLGYRDGMGSVVLPHGCPNNVPGILWSSRAVNWQPLFPNRSIPDDLLALFDEDYTPPVVDNIYRTLGVKQLEKCLVSGQMDPRAHTILLVLAAIRKKVRSVDQLAHAANLPYRVCEHVLANCIDIGLIDQNRYLTEQGLNELHYAEKAHVVPFEPPLLTNDFYVPTSLRATRE